jgi:hypothetical protein
MKYTFPSHHPHRLLIISIKHRGMTLRTHVYAPKHTLSIYNEVDGGRTSCLYSFLQPIDVNIYFFFVRLILLS